MALSVVARLALAVLLAGKRRFAAVYQTVYFLPVITPMVPMAITWKWIYDIITASSTTLLSLVGLPPVGLADRSGDSALGAGHRGRLEGLGLQSDPVPGRHPQHPGPVPRGREPGRRVGLAAFRFVTLPLLRPILLYVLVTATINAFNVFTQVYVMTLGSQSAPGQAVRVLVFDIYQNAFQYFHMGYASAEAVDTDLDRAGPHPDPVPLHARARSGESLRWACDCSGLQSIPSSSWARS